MINDRDTVARVFKEWASGTAYITSFFHPDMRWEIVGRSAASGVYTSAEQFSSEVLVPFGLRFDPADPFRPVHVRNLFHDEPSGSVIVVWDGAGTTVAGTRYENTYAWFLRMRDGKVVEGTAFYDSISFNELWNEVRVAARTDEAHDSAGVFTAEMEAEVHRRVVGDRRHGLDGSDRLLETRDAS